MDITDTGTKVSTAAHSSLCLLCTAISYPTPLYSMIHGPSTNSINSMFTFQSKNVELLMILKVWIEFVHNTIVLIT